MDSVQTLAPPPLLMSAPSTSRAPVSSATFAVFKRLRQLDELTGITDAELLDVVSSTGPKATLVKQKILACLFGKCAREGATSLLETRKAERRQEIKNNTPDSEKRMHDHAFNGVFSKYVAKELQKMGYPRAEDAGDDILRNKHIYVDVLSFLLVKIKASKDQLSKASQSCKPEALKQDSLTVESKSTSQPVEPSTRLKAATPAESTNAHSIEDRLPVSVVPAGRLKKIQQLKGRPLAGAGAISPDNDLAARVAALEQQVSDLRRQNEALKTENAQLRDLNEKVVAESTSGTSDGLDRRRAALLKSQIVQLERHVIAQRDAIVARESYVFEAGGEIKKVKNILKEIVCRERSKVTADQIASLKCGIQITETLLKQLSRRIKDHLNTREEERSPALEFLSEFVCPKRRGNIHPVTLADVCSGRIEHLNLRHVARLESQLHGLHSDLLALRNCIHASFRPHIPDFSEHLEVTYERAMSNLTSTMDALLSVSVLVPVAPAPAIRRVVRGGYPEIPTAADVLQHFPVLSANARSKAEDALKALLKAVQYYKEMHDREQEGLEKELEFHRGVYQKYNSKISSIADRLEIQRQEMTEKLEGIDCSTGGFHPLAVVLLIYIAQRFCIQFRPLRTNSRRWYLVKNPYEAF
ncbi:hypothetical protein HK104_007608 [Borealophlyctis nickersoniae]|nr:hypothetical protein HK104_007608 [Borealophlyctis nickersoniae]